MIDPFEFVKFEPIKRGDSVLSRVLWFLVERFLLFLAWIVLTLACLVVILWPFNKSLSHFMTILRFFSDAYFVKRELKGVVVEEKVV